MSYYIFIVVYILCISILLILTESEYSLYKKLPKEKADKIIILSSCILVFVFVVGLPINCIYRCITYEPNTEKWRTAEELTEEIERKWNINVEFISDEINSYGNEMNWHFKDSKGVEFTITGRKSFAIFGGSFHINYHDNYNDMYIYYNADDIFKPLNEEGLEVKYYEYTSHVIYNSEITNTYFANINSYYDLDKFFEIEKLIKLNLTPAIYDSYIYHWPQNRIGIRQGDIIISDMLCLGEDRVKEDYLHCIKEGHINEELPDEVIEQYFPKETEEQTMQKGDNNESQ